MVVKSARHSFLVAFSLCLLLAGAACAREGMWIPKQLGEREKEMKALGLAIPADKIYNENGTGLNNAVVQFGRGCTGEVISSAGLVLTNHHCGYSPVQALTGPDKDYFANGFWAMSNAEELPCPGLTVSFVRRMENISQSIVRGIPDTLSARERDTIVNRRLRTAEQEWKGKTSLEVTIKPFYNGNQYWVILTETFNDIRLVAFPPNGIGFFGGDEDNWTWPRHNADFSLFRIYGRDNKPARFSAENTPYKPQVFLPISTKGIKEGDFTMVYGFPGTTQEYISSYQLKQITGISDPIRVEARTKKLAVWTRHMDASREVFLKYTSKRGGVANGWKKWQGEMNGISRNNVVEKKQNYERDFQTYVGKDSLLGLTAGSVLSRIQVNTVFTESLLRGNEYLNETVFGIELVQQGAYLNQLLDQMRKGQPLNDDKTKSAINGFYKNFDLATDKDLFTAMMPMLFDKAPDWVPSYYRQLYLANGSSFQKWANYTYQISMAATAEKMLAFVSDAEPSDSNRIKADPAWQLYSSAREIQASRIGATLSVYGQRLSNLNREYLKYRFRKDVDTPFYPDANFTLRVSYGKVRGLDPDGPADYAYQTNLNEVIAKDNPQVDVFQVPEKLKALHAKKDYGRWAVNGTVPVAFVADNHTSGGNSGSPVLNAKGELIGLNFDRAWEGTMSDLYYDASQCRNISVDSRYILFLIEKFGNAGWLLKEMKLAGK